MMSSDTVKVGDEVKVRGAGGWLPVIIVLLVRRRLA